MTVFDLTALSVQDLMRLDAGIIAELRRRGLVRTSNKPLGDVAEAVVHAARGGVLESNSTKSHDITAPDGQRIQVKAMGVRSAGVAAKFSAFRSTDFTATVFLVFDANFDLVEAWEVGATDVELAPVVAHINGRLVTLRWVRAVGVDVTDEMRAAWLAVNSPQPDE